MSAILFSWEEYITAQKEERGNPCKLGGPYDNTASSKEKTDFVKFVLERKCFSDFNLHINSSGT